jgi:hypothetical protein
MGSTYALCKPKTAPDPKIGSNSYIGANPGGSTYFYIKVAQVTVSFSSPDVDVTGDGDTVPTFENNLLVYGRLRLSGFAIAGQAIGIANLVDTSKNPLVDIRLNHHSTRYIDGTWLVRAIQVAYSYDGALVGLTMDCVMTNTTPSGIES